MGATATSPSVLAVDEQTQRSQNRGTVPSSGQSLSGAASSQHTDDKSGSVVLAQGQHQSVHSPTSSTASPDCERENPCYSYLQELESLNPSTTHLASPANSARHTSQPFQGCRTHDNRREAASSSSGRAANPMNNHSRRLAPVTHASPRRRLMAPASPIHMAVPFGCYSFLEASIPKGLSIEDIAFLESQGCFHLPPKSVLRAWLEQYFLNVHVFLALLSDAPFRSLWSMDTEATKPDRVPLFLFQAILAAASPVCRRSPSPTRSRPSDHFLVRVTFCDRRWWVCISMDCAIHFLPTCQGKHSQVACVCVHDHHLRLVIVYTLSSSMTSKYETIRLARFKGRCSCRFPVQP